MMPIYVVLYNPCIYESAAMPIGYFKSLLSAYRCMRKARVGAFNEERDSVLGFGKWKPARKYLRSQWWGIKKAEVLD